MKGAVVGMAIGAAIKGIVGAMSQGGAGANTTTQNTNGTTPSATSTAIPNQSGALSVVLDVAKRIWALPNTIIGAAYGGVGMLFGATPVWDANAGILRFINMPKWMMPTAMSFGHVQVFGPGAYQNLDGSLALNRFNIPIVTEETLHTRQAEILGPLYLPAHAVSMGASLISGGGTHNNNLLEMGPERGKSSWPVGN